MLQILRSTPLPRAAQVVIATLMALALILAPSLVPHANAATGLAVTGTLVSPEGAVRTNFPVELRDAKGQTLASTRTAADGRFTLKQPTAGTQFHIYVPSSRKNTPNVW